MLILFKRRKIFIDHLEDVYLNNKLLKTHLDDLLNILGPRNADRRNEIASFTRTYTIAEIFNSVLATKKQYSEARKMMQLNHMAPRSSASCERTISATRR